MVGALAIEYPLERCGRKRSLIGCSIFTVIGIIIQVTASSKVQILAAEIINGVVRGAYPVLAGTYISEVTPVVLRSVSGTMINIAFVLGQLFWSAVLAGVQSLPDSRAYQIPFACQFIFPTIILSAVSLSMHDHAEMMIHDLYIDDLHTGVVLSRKSILACEEKKI